MAVPTQWNAAISAMANQISADVPDIEENFEEIQRILEAITNGTLGTTDSDLYEVNNLADYSVAAIKLATDSVETAKIKDSIVTAIKLATDAVETDKIKDYNVTAVKISNLNVTAAKLAADAVETAKIKDYNITAIKLATDSVETAKIKDSVVTAVKLAADAKSSYVKVSDTQASGTEGGTFTSGAWRTRVLNTEDSDTDNICSLAGNQITLAAGTYICSISAPGYNVGHHQLILYNVTGTATLLVGSGTMSGTSEITHSFVVGKFTVAAAQALEVRHICEVTKTTNGLGTKCDFTSEVYAVAEFWRAV